MVVNSNEKLQLFPIATIQKMVWYLYDKTADSVSEIGTLTPQLFLLYTSNIKPC